MHDDDAKKQWPLPSCSTEELAAGGEANLAALIAALSSDVLVIDYDEDHAAKRACLAAHEAIAALTAPNKPG